MLSPSHFERSPSRSRPTKHLGHWQQCSDRFAEANGPVRLKRNREEFESDLAAFDSPSASANKKRNIVTTNSRIKFPALPSEMKRHILSFLNVRELLDVGLVCWQWRIYSQDDQLWLLHYYHEWKFKPEYEPIYRNLGFNWLDFFILRFQVEKARYFAVDEHSSSDGVYECQEYLKLGKLLLDESGSVTDFEERAQLMMIACSEYRTAMAYQPESVEALVRYGDAVTDIGNYVTNPVLVVAALKAAESAYAEAKRLALPPPPSSPSRISKPPMQEITWSTDEDDKGLNTFDDRMDTSD